MGALVGFYSAGRGPKVWLSFAVMRAADVLQAFPVFVFAIALVAALGQSMQTVVLAIAFVNTPIYLRLMRSQVLSIRAMRYVEAAKVAGVSDIDHHPPPHRPQRHRARAGAALGQYRLVGCC